MSDELVEKVMEAIHRAILEEAVFCVGSDPRALNIDSYGLDLWPVAQAATETVVKHLAAEIAEQMKAGRPMPDEPGHPDLYSDLIARDAAALRDGKPLPMFNALSDSEHDDDRD